jgi:hypothetical protein
MFFSSPREVSSRTFLFRGTFASPCPLSKGNFILEAQINDEIAKAWLLSNLLRQSFSRNPGYLSNARLRRSERPGIGYPPFISAAEPSWNISCFLPEVTM